jgi:hypothetical protein
MAELKMRTIRDRCNPVRVSEPIDVNRKSFRDLNSKMELDRRLDQALKETFPASDSMAIIIASREQGGKRRTSLQSGCRHRISLNHGRRRYGRFC